MSEINHEAAGLNNHNAETLNKPLAIYYTVFTQTAKCYPIALTENMNKNALNKRLHGFELIDLLF